MALNQFKMSVQKGMVDPTILNQIYTAQVSAGITDGVVAGVAVGLSNQAGSVPVVTPLAAATTKPFGVTILNPFREKTSSGQLLEVAAAGSTLYVEVTEAVDRGDLVTYSAAGKFKKVANEVTEYAIGKVLDNGVNGSYVRIVVLDQPLKAPST